MRAITLFIGISAACCLLAEKAEASDAIGPYVSQAESGQFVYAVFNNGWLGPYLAPEDDRDARRAAIVGFTGEPGEEVVIPALIDGIEVYGIDEGAFNEVTGIRSLTIPATVRFLRAGTLNHCKGLENIHVAEDHPDFASVDGVMFDKEKTTLLAVGSGRAGHFQVPDGTTTIGPFAFSLCTELTRVTLPEGVTDVGGRRGGAFLGCTSLEQIDIPDTVMNLGQKSFQDCTSLKEVTVPPGITEISFGLFWNCSSLATVKLPDGITSIGNYAFAGCVNLTLPALPASLTTVGASAFMGCARLGVVVPASVTSIGPHAFHGADVVMANEGDAGGGE